MLNFALTTKASLYELKCFENQYLFCMHDFMSNNCVSN